ncbi:MAG: UDP-diphosphatase [Solimicrobium sp.]|jgi:undecaprenyl-diphosphatase|nr:UDP-diphosphatase [Solimicrobium sp.]
MDLFQIAILAVIQGAAELLPVSSSAHVIMAEKMMGLDPSTPEMTLLLVMLHTGTMFAVILYFWRSWKATYFDSPAMFLLNMRYLIVATALTGIVGLSLVQIIKHVFIADPSKFEVEHLFSSAPLMACALAAAGLLIIVSSRIKERPEGQLSIKKALLIGAVQGLCLPFRGFSRSGATISAGLVAGVARRRSEEFSFALVVVLTPAVLLKEIYRVYQAQLTLPAAHVDWAMQLAIPSVIGMVFSFLAGLAALRWLSRWLEQGRWHFFGGYCLLAALVVLVVG